MPKAVTAVTKEGKTVKEAVNKALNYFKVTEEEAIIEILSEGKKGLFGIGSKPAKVKVVLKEEVANERQLSDLLSDLNIGAEPEPQQGESDKELSEEVSETMKTKVGLAGVKEGRVIVYNPNADEGEDPRYATISPGERVKLYVNGQNVEGEMNVTAEDEIRVEIVHDEPESSFDLKISKNKVEAYLRYINHSGSRYRLKDQTPKSKLVLVAEVEDIIEEPTPSLDELKEFICSRKVVKGIIEENLEEVLTNPNSRESYLIAKGQPPIDGKNAHIRYLFMEKQKASEEEGLFSHDRLVSVVPGEVIAVKVHKEEGTDGWDIHGETIPHKGALDCEIRVKKGCEIIKNGEEALSTISGRPVLETMGQNTVLSIEPIYVVQEVSQATGNIKFAGDVEVKGDVRDGSSIEADGNVEVYGNVSRANIKAGASVVVHKMILGSTVMAGGRSALHSSILPTLEQLRESLGILYSLVKEQKEKQEGMDNVVEIDGPIIQHFIESRLADLPKTVLELSGKALDPEANPSEEVFNVINELYKNFCGLGPIQIGCFIRIQELQKYLEEVINYTKESLKKASYIKTRYVQNASLLSSGNVIIDGQGCYISSINAGGTVEICGSPGYARGVKIDAGGDVRLKDVGSDFDTQTLVKTGENSRITADVVNANVVVQVGKEKLRVMEVTRNFTSYLNKDGFLTVDKGK